MKIEGTYVKLIFDCKRISRFADKMGFNIKVDRVRKFFNNGANFRDEKTQKFMEGIRDTLYSKTFIGLGMELRKNSKLRATSHLLVQELEKESNRVG